MLRHRTAALLLVAVFAAGCGGGKKTSSSPVVTTDPGTGTPPGTGTNPGTGTAPVLTLSLGADATVAKGLTYQFQARLAHDGTEDDCTGTAVWSSSDPAVAAVAGGLVTALAEGTVTITGSCDGHPDDARVVVTPAEVVSIAIAPATGELPVGFQEQLAAVATLTDGTTADVTQATDWQSGDPGVLTVSNDPAALRGVVTAVATGSATVTGHHASSGASASVTRAVTAATLQSIEITPATARAPLGVSVQFHATGTFSDGATADITPSVVWSASTTNVVFVPGDLAGLATSTYTDTSTITATIDGVAPATATFTVDPAVISSIAIDPLSPALLVGQTLQLAIVATYTDGTAATTYTGGATPAAISELALWSSSVPTVADVSATGLLSAIAAGGATVSASYLDPVTGATLSTSTSVSVVTPATPILSYLTLSKGSVRFGSPLTGTVVLTSPALADTEVALESSNPALARVPASVVVLAGERTASFSIETSTPAPQRKAKVTIRASLDGATKIANLNVRKSGGP